MFHLGHLSDWHATSPAGASASELINKRFFGWLSWNLRRRHEYRQEVLGALVDDLKAQAPDHVAVTGDLTNLSLEREFVGGASWLARLGSPEWVSLVPGNHDAYVRIDPRLSWDLWAPYMRSDACQDEAGKAPCFADYPTLRIRGEVALVGLCSAQPTPLFRATGQLGSAQLTRLAVLLRELREKDLCRVILLHHPPIDRETAPRRCLLDAEALRAVLAREGAELLLHGHLHRSAFSELSGPETQIPVVGVRSSSNAGAREYKRAQYHLYTIERNLGAKSGRRFSVRVVIRAYDPRSGTVVSAGERALSALTD